MTTPDNQDPTDEPLALSSETLDDLDPQNDTADVKGGGARHTEAGQGSVGCA